MRWLGVIVKHRTPSLGFKHFSFPKWDLKRKLFISKHNSIMLVAPAINHYVEKPGNQWNFDDEGFHATWILRSIHVRSRFSTRKGKCLERSMKRDTKSKGVSWWKQKIAAAKNEEKIISRVRWKSVKTIWPRRSRCHPSARSGANLSNSTFRFLIFIWGTLNSNIWWNHALRLATKLSRARRISRRKVTNCLSRVNVHKHFRKHSN